MTREEKRKEWTRKVDLFEKSGLSMLEWCEENGEVYNSLRRWKEIISGNKQTVNTSEDKWVSIDIPAAKTYNKSIKVSINEFTVEIDTGFNKDLLTDVFKVLKTV